MKTFTCGAARLRLPAFHDRELTTSDQIAVAAHLDVCPKCAELVADADLVGAALRAMAPGRRTLDRDEAAGFHASVVNRLSAERDASFVARVRVMFDDMHLVYAGLGAAARQELAVRRHVLVERHLIGPVTAAPEAVPVPGLVHRDAVDPGAQA